MIIEQFDVHKYTVLSIFTEVKVPFYIPIYQRKYNWTMDDQITELIEDLEEFYNEHGEDSNASYYLGNIVVKSKLNEITGIIEEYTLIDGQQRLTTILLFANYLKYALKHIGNKISDNDRVNKIKSLEDVLYLQRGKQGGDRRLQIKNPNSDNILKKIFELSNFKNVDEIIKNTNYFKNYEGIKEALNIKSIEEWDKWMSILNRVKIAQISLGAKDKEISVFETINSKGLPLNILDLSRNYLFLVAENSNLNEDSKKEIDILFTKLEPSFMKKNGKKDIKAINRFFAAFITREKLIDPSKERKILYKHFKTLINGYVEKSEFDDFMKSLTNLVNDYIELQKLAKNFNNSPDIQNYSKSYLANSKFDLYLPLFFIIENKKRNNEINLFDEEKIYKLLDLHNISLSITNKKNKDNRFIFKYIVSVNGNIRYESLLKYLNNSFDNKSRMTTIKEFKHGIKNTDIYEIDNKIARYILYRIENWKRLDSGEKIDFDYTIEHIFPVNDKNWSDKFDNEEYKNSRLHTLGNLTLVKQKLNSKMSNSSYDKKLKEIKKSSLKINNELFNSFKDWKIFENDDNSLERVDEIYNVINKIWPLELLIENKPSTKYDEKIVKILISINKLTIADAIKIILFKNYPNHLNLNEITSEITNLYDYINNSNLNINIKFNRGKISTGGWLTERLYSNWTEKSEWERFQKPLFERDEDDEWTITSIAYDELNNT